MLTEEQGCFLLKLSRKAVENFVNNRETQIPEHSPELDKEAGVFCTIYKNNSLRACIGIPYAVEPLISAVVNASCSACHDPRFPVLKPEELGKISIELSILSEPQKTPLEAIEPGNGIILKKGMNSSLFLPQVWEQLPKKEQFLSQLSLKAGLSPDAWQSGTDFYKFSVQIFKEK